MAKIIYTTGKLIVTGSDTFTVHNAVSGTRSLIFSASVGAPTYNLVTYNTASGKLFITKSADLFSVAGNPGGPTNNSIQLNQGGNFTGSGNFNFDISTNTVNVTGSVNISGDISAKGPFNSIQFNDAGNLSGSSEFTYDKSSGVIRMSSSKSPSITSILTETDSSTFIQNVTTTGPAYRMNLADVGGSGSAAFLLGNQKGAFGGTGFTARYTTGSNASQGEIIMTIGKNGAAGALENRFIVASEPGPIATNTRSELTLQVGGNTFDRRVVQGVVQNATGDYAEFVAGNQDSATGFLKHVLLTHALNSTSSHAGFTSSSLRGSGVSNFNPNAVPFGVVAGGPTIEDLTDTVFYIDRGGSLGSLQPVTASLQISRGGHINMEGSLSASGNITASGFLFISASENAAQGYRVLVHDRVSGRVYATGSYVGTVSPYVTGSGPGDIQPRIGSNTASGSFSTVGGGQFNEAFGHNNFIAGGSGSIAKGIGNVVLGGQFNSISGSTKHSVIAGSGNVIDVNNGSSNIVSGINNTLTGLLASGIVMTGQGNSSLSKGSVLFGLNNTISGEAYYYHVGGISNTISGTETLSNNPGAIMGGGSNTLGSVIGQGQMIIGGLSNTVAGYTGNSSILNGQNNIIDDALQPTQQFNKTYLLILNGEGNQITGSALANTGAGAKDKSGKFSTIVNGEANRIETGGTGTDTFYKYNTILNGSNNFVSGSGVTAGVSGMYNTIVNGDNNIIGPDISGSTIAAGNNIKADRSDTVFAANLSLTNLPTSDTGLPVGAVYRDGTTLKIVI